VIKRMKGLIFQ